MTSSEIQAVIALATAVVSLIGTLLNRRRMTLHLRKHRAAADVRRQAQQAAEQPPGGSHG